ncbi:MAG: biosynthetic arginine decarboxylase [Planctomycetes bacterium]|nr:biosynthetic arginine decarboxylase [Planctomycetota bacterium]
MARWTHLDSETLYNVSKWGLGFFRINEQGNVEAKPEPDRNGASTGIDLHELLGQLLRRGVSTPILLRFDGILRARVRSMNEAFNNARKEFQYEAPYRGVFPIKVNQERHVVEALLAEGANWQMGLEVGSKPELIAVVALMAGRGSLMVCNGYKDEEYIEMALMSTKLGITPIIVVEKFSELDTVLRVARGLNIRPNIGVRSKLSGKGAGRWQESGGDRSKFGLTTREIVEIVERLERDGLLDCLQLLHFHLGSQIPEIRSLKNALKEATHTLVSLSKMGVRIKWFDVGGGLGVDYDGSSTNFESSMNYSMQEYANDVVYHLQQACLENEIEQPGIITESGRALTAHHAVLVTEVLGTSDFTSEGLAKPPVEDEHELIHNFHQLCENVTAKNYQESYHDAMQMRDEAMVLFNVGQVGMRERARVEDLFWRTCEKILKITRTLDYVPDDLANLERDMADTYFLNFSLFQSVPDSWAIHQLFPILPLHRHTEQPTRRGILADITCDSDGKVDRFIDLRDVKRTLELHPLKKDEPYYLGFFLVGAYQEILGDMHNLFGDTNVVHVDMDEAGRPRLTHVLRGERVQDVLEYVEYFETDLLSNLRRSVENSLEEGRITFEESALIYRRYENGLHGYTYLTREKSRVETPSFPQFGAPGSPGAPGAPGAPVTPSTTFVTSAQSQLPLTGSTGPVATSYTIPAAPQAARTNA